MADHYNAITAELYNDNPSNSLKPCTIVLSNNGEAGWVSRLTVKNLYALSKAANKTMTLTLPDSRQFTVIFDRSNRAPIEAQQVMPFAYPDNDNQYLLTLRLLTFQPTSEAVDRE